MFGENGESASCPLLFWCRPITGVVVEEERLTQPRFVIEGEGEKIASQHDSTSCFLCLSPLSMYFLHADGGGGLEEKKGSLGPWRSYL